MVHAAHSDSVAGPGTFRFVVLFCLSFLFPVALLGGYLYLQRSTPSSAAVETRGDRPRAFLVRDPGDVVRIKDSAAIEPAGDKDFLFTISLKFLNLPESEQKTFLLQKYDKNSEEGQGYSIAFIRDTDGIHPLVYWKNTEGGGRWFRFTALPVIEKQWFALALSFLRGEFLGLHALTVTGDSVEGRLLGGYRLDSPVYPSSDSDLIIGSISSGSPLEARLGGLIVVQRRGLDTELQELLDSVRIDPVTGTLEQQLDVPSSFSVGSFSESRRTESLDGVVTLYRSGHPIRNKGVEAEDGS